MFLETVSCIYSTDILRQCDAIRLIIVWEYFLLYEDFVDLPTKEHYWLNFFGFENNQTVFWCKNLGLFIYADLFN